MPSKATRKPAGPSGEPRPMKYRPLSSLKPLPGNPRVTKDEGFRDLCDSIRRNPDFFAARPLILSDRTGELIIIAGNMKYEAAKANGLSEAPTILLPKLTEAQEREIIIRDNAHAGEFNWEVLANEWSDLPLAEWGVLLPKDWGPVPDFQSVSAEEQERLDQKKPITCPECGHEFVPQA